MTSPLEEALRRSRDELHRWDDLAADLRAARLSFDPRTLPPRPRAVAPVDRRDEPVLPPAMSAEDVLRAWERGGVSWVDAVDRRRLTAVAAAVAHPAVGPTLSANAAFVQALLPRLRPRRRAVAAGRMWFHHFPPPASVAGHLQRLRAELPEGDHPRWWQWLPKGPQAAATQLAHLLRQREWVDVRADYDLPDEACADAWATAVCEAAAVRDVDQGERLLRYVDRGVDVGTPSRLPPAGLRVVKALVALGQDQPAQRLRIVARLRRRLGDVFGSAELAGWRGLEEERDRLRSWVAGEILDVLFKHLVPATDSAHHTEPRRKFWRRYTHKVDRLWLLVERGLRRRLDAPELREMLARCGSIVSVQELEGGSERALVWMHLRTQTGTLVTVVDGNANTSFRARGGAHKPRAGVVHYSTDVVNGGFVVERPHQGGWEARIDGDLRNLGVFR